MSPGEFEADLADLSSAEDFLDYFDIDYDPAVVHVNRLHILQRFHDYLEGADTDGGDSADRHAVYRDLLRGAYQDFVRSDARSEKVFRVFRMQDPHTVTVPVSALRRPA